MPWNITYSPNIAVIYITDKPFVEVTACCKRMCYKMMSPEFQAEMYCEFKAEVNVDQYSPSFIMSEYRNIVGIAMLEEWKYTQNSRIVRTVPKKLIYK